MKYLAWLALCLIAHPFVRAWFWAQEKAAALVSWVHALYAEARSRIVRKAMAVRTWCAWKLDQAKALFGIE